MQQYGHTNTTPRITTEEITMTNESLPDHNDLPINSYPPQGWDPCLTSDPIWTDAYCKAIETFGLRHDAAVEFADSTLRLSRSQA